VISNHEANAICPGFTMVSERKGRVVQFSLAIVASIISIHLFFLIQNASIEGLDKKNNVVIFEEEGEGETHPSFSTTALKVYILCGQSNMVGHAKVSVMENQLDMSHTRKRWAQFRMGNNSGWTNNDNVYVHAVVDGKVVSGPLSVGFGGSSNEIGPEFAFGHKIAKYHKNDRVLLVKAAWGGKSLYRDFKSPSAAFPTEDFMEEEHQGHYKGLSMEDYKKTFGVYYQNMMNHITTTLMNYSSILQPVSSQGTDAKGKLIPTRYEVMGFVWFQGWNDQFSDYARNNYRENLINFIRDVRSDLKQPNLPFVIGALGVGGLKKMREHGPNKITEAQIAVSQHEDFLNTVRTVSTAELWDEEAEEAFATWRTNPKKWAKFGSDRPYHYLGSPFFFYNAGSAFAEAIIELLESQSHT